jgi:DNA-binding MarR family transcriptional regulator
MRTDAPPLEGLLRETVALFHRLKVVVTQLHAGGEMAAGKRGILESLESGPQTVPQLARARPVSRQHVQSLVDPLSAAGYVELVPNPHHRRSRLVRLTAKGLATLERIRRREKAVYARLPKRFEPARLRAAARQLQEVREWFAGDDWSALVAKLRPVKL